MNKIDNYYSRGVTWCATLLLVGFTAGCGGGGEDPLFGAGVATNTVAPTVVSTNPMDGASGVCTNGLRATFSQAMDPSTITVASFRVTGPDTTPVAGTAVYSAATGIATFTPSASLAAST